MAQGSKQEQGRGRQPTLRAAEAAMVGLWLLLGLPAPLPAGEKQPKAVKIVGSVVEIEPTRVSIRDEKGGEVILQTGEDFREKVAVESKVTAWYFSKDGTKVLKWMEYPLESLFRPASEIQNSVKKIILLPSSDVPDADGIFDALTKYVESNFGWYVAPRMLAEEIRNRAGKPASALDALDPTTGDFDMARYLGGQRDFIRNLASETRMEAVLEVNVERVAAPVSSMTAHWDGVEQPIANKKSRFLTSMGGNAGEGEVPAATVALKLWDAQGKVMWSNRRGFAVLGVLVGLGSKFQDHTIPETLQDAASVESWLGKVFGSLLPANGPAKTTAWE